MIEESQKQDVNESNQKTNERNKYTKKRLQSSDKLPKIKFDEGDGDNKDEQKNKFNIGIVRRSYKFKTNKSVKINIPFP